MANVTTKFVTEKWEAHSGEDYTVVMRPNECTENASISIYGEDAEKLSKLVEQSPKMADLLYRLYMQIPLGRELDLECCEVLRNAGFGI